MGQRLRRRETRLQYPIATEALGRTIRTRNRSKSSSRSSSGSRSRSNSMSSNRSSSRNELTNRGISDSKASETGNDDYTNDRDSSSEGESEI